MKMNIDEIYVGMPVTVSVGSDCYPYEVISKSGKSTVIIRECKPVKMADWAEGCDTTEYESLPNGKTMELSNRGNHGWHVKGDHRGTYYGWCHKIGFGVARYYRDPSF